MSCEITEERTGQGLTSINEVTNSGNEVKSKPETSALVAVSFLENAKDFQVTNDMLNGDAKASEFTIRLFCCFTQGLLGWFTLRGSAITVEVLKPLIASVC